jgi:hypothetical protein
LSHSIGPCQACFADILPGGEKKDWERNQDMCKVLKNSFYTWVLQENTGGR